jgi:hypothetical protein
VPRKGEDFVLRRLPSRSLEWLTIGCLRGGVRRRSGGSLLRPRRMRAAGARPSLPC